MAYEFNSGLGTDAFLEQLAFDPRERYATFNPAVSNSLQTPSTNAMVQTSRAGLNAGWQLPLDMTAVGSVSPQQSPTSANGNMSSPEEQTVESPSIHHSSTASSPHQHQALPLTQATQQPMMADWLYQQQQVQSQPQEMPQYQAPMLGFNPYAGFPQPNAMSYLPATTQAALSAGLQQVNPMAFTLPGTDDQTTQQVPWAMGMNMTNWQEFDAALRMQPSNVQRVTSAGSTSPTGTILEVLSLGSGSDQDWTAINMHHSYDFQQSQQAHNAAVFNPSQTLHLRNSSDSSEPKLEFGSYEEVTFPPYSPSSDAEHSQHSHRNCYGGEHHHDLIASSSAIGPIPIKSMSVSRASPSSSSGSGVLSVSSISPTNRKSLGPRKSSPIAKSTKSVIRKNSTGKKDGTGDKKVGKRRGPLLPEQRKQASEIRKLRACLRCKFLKKTCDKGEPCAGCQPSHARLWQVPCTRIDIKDVSYFMKDWKADFERHVDLKFSVYNVKGFAEKEKVMWVTHGYGFALPIMTREVYVADENCFTTEWVESILTDQEPIEFEVRTGRLDVGREGISREALSEYLDKHMEKYDEFVDNHFEGTPFLTEMLKTAYKYYQKEQSPIIRKALKLVLAYNLTTHITMVENEGSEEQMEGAIDDEDSKYFGRTVTPVMVNFQIKCAMADMWRELQKEVLEELSALYSKVYNGDRLKRWPTIFMLAAILLAVWEEMQFDCHYRIQDPVAVDKFCRDMETTPVGVIVGLFHAISQKLPAFTEWDTKRHGQLLDNNPAVCDAMTEVREHVTKHEQYLRARPEAKFDRDDFDSLSNKFLSKLVIRAN